CLGTRLRSEAALRRESVLRGKEQSKAELRRQASAQVQIGNESRESLFVSRNSFRFDFFHFEPVCFRKFIAPPKVRARLPEQVKCSCARLPVSPRQRAPRSFSRLPR